MDLIGNAKWQEFRDLIGTFAQDTFFQKEITWKRYVETLDYDGEQDTQPDFTDVPVLALIDYNDFKTWGNNIATETGEINKLTVSVFFTNKYLKDNNLLDSSNNFPINIQADRFVIDGIIYKPSGVLNASQAKDNPVLIKLNLQIDVKETGG